MDRVGGHLTAREVEAYRERTMADTARRRADGHLAVCDACMDLILDAGGQSLAAARLSEAFFRPDDSPFHMSGEDLSLYAKGSVDEADRVVFESHLEMCPECAAACKGMGDRSRTGKSELRGVKSKPWNRRPGPETRAWLRSARYVIGTAALLAIFLLVWAIWRSGIESKRAQQASVGEQAGPAPAQPNASEAGGNERLPRNIEKEGGPPGPSLAPSLKDGDHEVGLDQRGDLVGLGSLPKSEEALIRSALESGQIPKPSVLRELAGAPIKLMDRTTDGVSFKVVSPVKTVIVEDQPEFHWERLAGAASYTVSVFDDNFDMVVKSEPETGTSWRSPIRLKRGEVYSWEVTALKDGKEITAPTAPAPRSQFRVLRSAELAALNDARKREPRSHLALGVVYARMGLVKEVETEFSTLASENPDSAIARKLLAEAKSWMSH
jgi:hypothetical protein